MQGRFVYYCQKFAFSNAKVREKTYGLQDCTVRSEERQMSIKLIAADMDGTVLKSDKTVGKRTEEAIRKAIENGVMVIPATGRIVRTIPKQVVNIPGIRYAVTSNGASVVDLREKRVLYHNLMSMEKAGRAVRLITSYGLMLSAYCDGVAYADRSALRFLPKDVVPEGIYDLVVHSQTPVEDLPGFLRRNNRPLEKINIPYVPEELRLELTEKIIAIGGLSVTSSGMLNLEINADRASKGDGLSHLCSIFAVSPSQVMALGDSDNDRTMLEYAGVSVAMGNASDEIKRQADFVTDTNEEEGAAKAIEEFVLKSLPA